MMSAPARRDFVASGLLERNRVSRAFFAREAQPLALACREMAARFNRGGRLLAFGRGPYATDAQHVAVEFVHPILVGKRALPAVDLSHAFQDRLPAIVRADDIVIGFGPPDGDPDVARALTMARGRGAQTFALPGHDADYGVAAADRDPFIHQEVVEVLYHTLWETVHVFLEHSVAGNRASRHDAGPSAFLYPFLGRDTGDTSDLVSQVAESIRAKAEEDERLRSEAATEHCDRIVSAAAAMADRVERGGTLLPFGNGGSATDANDFACDCVASPKGYRPIPALSLSMDPATVSAIANDVGAEAVFLRQLIAHARPGDVAIAFSTSGGSAGVMAALDEARKRGLLTVALLGYGGGEIARRGLADFPIAVRCSHLPRIQELHASIYHVMLDVIGTAEP